MNLQAYASEPLAIDLDYAVKLLAEHDNVMRMLEAGMPYSEAGYSERRAKQKMSDFSGIAHIKLSGFMQMEDPPCGRGVESIIRDFYSANLKSEIKGILLEVNSGGGQATAGTSLRNAVKDSVKPVVVYGHTMGSAAYWASVYADEIMLSSETASAGSIGCFISLSKKFLETYSDNYQDIYAEESPEKNKAFRAALTGDFSHLQTVASDLAKAFQANVQETRPLKGDITNTLQGGMFMGKDAKKRGLVDSIGTFNQAVEVLNYYIQKRKK